MKQLDRANEGVAVALQWDSRGRPIQWKKGNEIYHYECPHCGRKMHFGSAGALYCDPCDDYWNGSEEVVDMKGNGELPNPDSISF